MRAILVEDELIMQRSFRRISAEIEDFELLAMFDNADDALRFVELNEVDAAFIDIYLPNVNGFQLAAMIRLAKPQLKLVFVSASEAFSRDYDGFGAVDFLLKPYSRERLKEVIKKIQSDSHRP